jgi:hypothetical protein
VRNEAPCVSPGSNWPYSHITLNWIHLPMLPGCSPHLLISIHIQHQAILHFVLVLFTHSPHKTSSSQQHLTSHNQHGNYSSAIRILVNNLCLTTQSGHQGLWCHISCATLLWSGKKCLKKHKATNELGISPGKTLGHWQITCFQMDTKEWRLWGAAEWPLVQCWQAIGQTLNRQDGMEKWCLT